MPIYPIRRVIDPRNSSPVTKGTRMFVDQLADGRTAWARRWNDLVILHVNDLGGFGAVSEAQLSICRRASALECELESAEGKLSGGEPIDINLYARLARTLCRLLELVGVRRLAKPLDPTSELSGALRGYGPEPDEEEEPGEAHKLSAHERSRLGMLALFALGAATFWVLAEFKK